MWRRQGCEMWIVEAAAESRGEESRGGRCVGVAASFGGGHGAGAIADGGNIGSYRGRARRLPRRAAPPPYQHPPPPRGRGSSTLRAASPPPAHGLCFCWHYGGVPHRRSSYAAVVWWARDADEASTAWLLLLMKSFPQC
uniref:Uncharacterized protein n=1 Tax=Arundo donax TaxID=35708 RepID=A0A0A9BTU9_ARUDO